MSACNPGEFRVATELGPGAGAQHKWDTININHEVNNACTDVICCLHTYFCSSSPDVQAKKIDTIDCTIRRRIHSTGTSQAMAQPHNDQSCFDEDFLHYLPEELTKQPVNCFNHLSSVVAATEASMRFSAVLPAIASSSQPVPCRDSNSNSNNITNMTSVENTRLVDGSTIVEGAISLEG